MGKRVKIGLIIVLLVFDLYFISADITGQVANSHVNVSLFILPPPLSVEIISPENKTYITNESLVLNFTASGAEIINYSVDGGVNITITGPVGLNLSQGGHNLTLYAINSSTIITRNVSFSINSSLLTILYSEYFPPLGYSPDFIKIPYERLLDFPDLCIKKINYGEICFNENLNLIADSNTSDRLVDFDNNTEIGFDSIELDSNNLINLNRSASIRIYNLTLVNPRILRNGQLCPSTICIFESYINGTLRFNVTSFTTYSADETPTISPTPIVVVGGGGGGLPKITNITLVENFTLDQTMIKTTLNKGQTKKIQIKIKNTLDRDQQFSITLRGLENLGSISPSSFSLEPGKESYIELELYSEKEGVYTGTIDIQGKNQYNISVIVEVSSEISPINLGLKIDPSSKPAKPGDTIVLITTIENPSEIVANLSLQYYIKDLKNNQITTSDSSIYLDKKNISFKTILKIPEDIGEGTYIIGLVAESKGIKLTAVTSEILHVEIKKYSLKQLLIIFPVILIPILIIIAIILLRKFYIEYQIASITEPYDREIFLIRNRIKQNNLSIKEAVEINKRLEELFRKITELYQKTYITKERYLQDKKQLLKTIENLKLS